MLQDITAAVKSQTGSSPEPAQIWKSIRDPDIPRRIRNFLWIAVHSAHKVGNYWKHIPDCDARVTCAKCQVTEDLEHILLKCDRPWCKLIWDIAEDLWPKKPGYGPWIQPTIGLVIGCNLTKFRGTKELPATSIKRLYRTLVLECAHLIWKLQCEAVIDRENADIPELEAYNRLKQALSRRLERDQILTYKPYWKEKSLPKSLVLQTWGSMIKPTSSLQPDTGEPGVLVGIGPITKYRPHTST